jgi:hypothetical protein
MPSLANVASRIQAQVKERGILATFGFLASRLFRHQVTCVLDADLRVPLPSVEWAPSESVLIVGPQNVDSALGARERAFLGGTTEEFIPGLRTRDLLFLISDGGTYLHRSYVMLNASTGKKLIGEEPETPLIGYAYTSDAARGRGIFKRALGAELLHLQSMGYKRALFEFHPDNTPSKKGSMAAGFSYSKIADVWIAFNLVAAQRLKSNNGTRWKILFL